MPQQFDNPANPQAHRETTAEEIWRDTGGRIDALVTSVGTGGTLTGCGALLKARDPNVRIVAVEPEDSQVLSGGAAGQHMIEGIGAGFVPAILDTGLIDEVIPIANETAFRLARQTAALEGLPVGISAGAAIASSLIVNFGIELFDVRLPHNIHGGTISLLLSTTVFLAVSLASPPPALDPDVEAVMDI